jgi:hypothetical protein
MQELGKGIIVVGIILIGLGSIVALTGKIPHMGRLPGDILIQKKNFTFYFPLATSVIISVVLSLILWLFSKR